MLETILAEHAVFADTLEGSASLISRSLFNDLFQRIGDQNARLREASEDILL